MKPTVPDFIPERLTEAREARGWTQTALSDVLPVSRQAVSQYERKQSAPSIQVLSEIANRLRFPQHRFVRPLNARHHGPAFFRSLATATKTARTRARRRFIWLRDDICGYLAKYIAFPPIDFPVFDVPADPEKLDRDDIERLATETRRAWELEDGPISDVVLLLENHGAIMVRQELGANTLDAFSERDVEYDGRPYMVLGTEKASAVRSRFDAAHELGHIILHSQVPQSVANRTDMFPLVEAQANFFARSFLLPKSSFGAEFRTASVDALVPLKSHWKVAIGAMIFRARDLGLIDEYRAQRMHANRSRRWGRKWEPLDDELNPEQPRFVRRSFDLLLDRGLISLQSIQIELALYVEDIENTAGLEPGFFGDDVSHFRFPSVKGEQGTLVDTDTPCLPFSRPRDSSPILPEQPFGQSPNAVQQ